MLSPHFYEITLTMASMPPSEAFAAHLWGVQA